MRLSRQQQQARAKLEDALASNLPVERLGVAVVDALGIAIPNDGFRLLGIDPQTLLVNSLIAASDNDAWARSEWLREIYLHADPISYIELHELMRMGVRAAASHERQDESWGIPQAALETVAPAAHTEAFHELRSPTGGTLFGCFPARGQWVAALQVYRRDGSPGFRRTDVAFLESLSARIGEALAGAARGEAFASLDPDADLPTTGVVALDASGGIAFRTPAGVRWLAALGGSEQRLPEGVLAALARARTEPGGVAAVRADSDYGPVLIEASRADSGSSFAVVLAPAPPPQGPRFPPAWELTPAEARVVELALTGLSNAEIAERLYVSTETARTHLRHVYEKLGVRNRNQLLARYFRSTLEPGVD